MLTMFWSAKGGSGTSVVTATHAIIAASERPTLLVDLAGDLPGVLGVDPPDAGIGDWLDAGAEVGAEALARVAVPVAPDLRLLGAGSRPIGSGPRAEVLGRLLADAREAIVVDLGRLPHPVADTLLDHADRSILVTRACYLAIRRAQLLQRCPTEIVILREPGRALRDRDIAEAVGAPIRSTVAVDPEIARAVDAGLLLHRLPRPLRRAGLVPT